MDEVFIEDMKDADAPAVLAIYAEGIATGDATFEEAAPDWARWNEEHLAECRYVARDGTGVLGWAALSPVSGRCVYGGVAEVSIYVAAAAQGRGVGRGLLTRLIEGSERAGLWTLQAGIFRENVASLRVHERCGFREVGYREALGQHGGVWRDIVLLERRSPTVGRPR